MAVIKNPWAGRGFVEDLSPEIRDCAPDLGALLTDMVLDAAGGGDMVEGYGKSAIDRWLERRGRTCVRSDPYAAFRKPLPQCGGCKVLPFVLQHTRPRQRPINDPLDGQERWRQAVALPNDPNLGGRCTSSRRDFGGAWGVNWRASASPDRRPVSRS